MNLNKYSNINFADTFLLDSIQIKPLKITCFKRIYKKNFLSNITIIKQNETKKYYVLAFGIGTDSDYSSQISEIYQFNNYGYDQSTPSQNLIEINYMLMQISLPYIEYKNKSNELKQSIEKLLLFCQSQYHKNFKRVNNLNELNDWHENIHRENAKKSNFMTKKFDEGFNYLKWKFENKNSCIVFLNNESMLFYDLYYDRERIKIGKTIFHYKLLYKTGFVEYNLLNDTSDLSFWSVQ